jgi:hypothetical protein
VGLLGLRVTDMRRGTDSLSAMVEAVIKEASASVEDAPTGSSFYGGMANGSACSTRFSNADTFPGPLRKLVLRI